MILQWVDIPDLLEYFRDQSGTNRDIAKVKQLSDNLKFIFPGTTATLQVLQGHGVYKFQINYKREVLGWVVFIPGEKRFDIIEASNPQNPLIQVKQKKVHHRSYSDLLAAANVEKIFEKLFNLTT